MRRKEILARKQSNEWISTFSKVTTRFKADCPCALKASELNKYERSAMSNVNDTRAVLAGDFTASWLTSPNTANTLAFWRGVIGPLDEVELERSAGPED